MKGKEMLVSDETKITLKMGIIASIVASVLIFILTSLWVHQTDITLLKTNQGHVLSTLQELKAMPSQMAVLNAQIGNIASNLEEHRKDERRRTK